MTQFIKYFIIIQKTEIYLMFKNEYFIQKIKIVTSLHHAQQQKGLKVIWRSFDA